MLSFNSLFISLVAFLTCAFLSASSSGVLPRISPSFLFFSSSSAFLFSKSFSFSAGLLACSTFSSGNCVTKAPGTFFLGLGSSAASLNAFSNAWAFDMKANVTFINQIPRWVLKVAGEDIFTK